MATAYSDNENGVEDNTEEVLIKYYFYRGYQYKDILDLLATYNNIEISEQNFTQTTTDVWTIQEKPRI